MQQITIVKIGGNIIDSDDKMQAFLHSFAHVSGYKILVHGGGKVATEIGKRLEIEPKYLDGRRITDAATLELVTMVYGGLVNKKIVAQLQSVGCNALGLTGADANVIPAVKRPVKDVDYGFAGDVSSRYVKGVTLKSFLEMGLTPVLAPLTHDLHGNMLNTNADTIAQEVAKSLTGYYKVKLIYCFEKPGVLANANDDSSVIPKIEFEEFEGLKTNGVISGGMIPKLENAFEAINMGVNKVIIGHADDLIELISGRAGTGIL